MFGESPESCHVVLVNEFCFRFLVNNFILNTPTRFYTNYQLPITYTAQF